MHNYLNTCKIVRDPATGQRNIVCLGNTLVKHLSAFPTRDEIFAALAPLADVWSAPGANGATHPGKRVMTRKVFNTAARDFLRQAGFLAA
jgi:hypothetical protein